MESLDTVTGSSVGKVLAGELVTRRSGVSVLVVGDDEDERKLFDGGLVDGFVERASRGCAFANAGCANCAWLALETAGHERAIDDGDHCAKMADHRQQAFARFAAVDIAIAPSHRAKRGTEISASGVQDSFTKGQTAGLVANEGREDVAL